MYTFGILVVLELNVKVKKVFYDSLRSHANHGNGFDNKLLSNVSLQYAFRQKKLGNSHV